MTAKQVYASLRALACGERAASLERFVQAVPGGYGEGDRLLGCTVPDQRKIARQFRELPTNEIEKLLASPWHECRLTGLLILVDQFEQAAKPKNPTRVSDCRIIVEFYLANLTAVNNWDLVDSTAPKILGAWLVEHPSERDVLERLGASQVLWERRVAVLATFPLIRKQEFTEILRLAEHLLDDTHDLMHKAIGWMLREMGKRDPSQLENFLKKYARVMPRTMLRYSIEKLSKEVRAKWMHR
ncbi:DNA alkylation repair protein [Aureliella helgolandensis]|uniref:DNA alkylation repair enzyme n=1 Tax=Aureliella helgolandensis TaxID=2527968 RepID=A0A518G7P0_9BACT|nr:DNA alkylation repair protein [Aureliella helgolandensis]QDV24607.1 DNA alkylation repair enzyme [Aureliella helgolandensis]